MTGNRQTYAAIFIDDIDWRRGEFVVAGKQNALARRLRDRQDDYLRSPPTDESRPTVMDPNATSA
jgi:hypothetical protein